LAPDDGQQILARATGTGVVTGEEVVAHDVAQLVLPIDAGGGLVGGGFPRTTLQARKLIMQLLIRSAQSSNVRRLCLNEVQQLDDDRAHRQIGNCVRVELRNLHFYVIYQTVTMLSTSAQRQ
jgi:hypothetical protein